MRRIVVLFDGTWNTPEQTFPAAACPTNIVRIKRLIVPVDTNPVRSCSQIVCYVRGVGTYSRPENFVAGAGGYGIERHIRQGYEFISDNYSRAENDQLFLFGFSRGAYTARSLAGLLHEWGIIPKEQMHRFPRVYELYKRGRGTTRGQVQEYEDFFCEIHGMSRAQYQAFENERASRLKERISENESVRIDKISVPVWFLGVWDTVATIGYPDPIFDICYQSERDYHLVALTPNVTLACQALAIHELRAKFKPELWTTSYDHQQVAQVWFPGAHSDVGGGQRVDALSNSSLLWMVQRAEEAHLRFDTAAVGRVANAPCSPINISINTPIWRKLGTYLRHEMGDPSQGVYQCLHESASFRLTHERNPEYPWKYRGELRSADELSQSHNRFPIVGDTMTLHDIKRFHRTNEHAPFVRPTPTGSSLIKRVVRWLL